ncbi:RidA family protein [Nissabacter sp. SGAir0207]|uniref:RidA family protein n=1 Tax=Nissabacter sp. SGAir0207 TaxID=2126321 RepID=UPI0010CD04F2|nr:RidA family protein [Nissabacter sp. SGAir0207]QCR38265.1 RidA family protein [Nissabacter sp. SGAir0207]
MTLPFSKTRQIGDQLWLSGELGMEEDGSFAPEIARQTDRMMEKISATLEGAGYGLSDVFACTVYLTDSADFAAFNQAYARWFSAPLPVRATVQAGLMLPGAKVEISVVAAKG